MTKIKSLFASKTFWFTVATFWVAIAPQLQSFADQERWPSPSESIQLITLLITTGGAIYGRVSAGGVHTPNWLPGPNPTEEA